MGDYTWNLSQALSQKGVQVHVVCREQEKIEELPGVTIHPVVKNWGFQVDDIILGIIRRVQPDWVGLQYVPYGFNRLGFPISLTVLLAKIKHLGVPIGITFHEVHVRLKGWRGWLIGNIQRQIARSLCGKAKVCVTSIEFYKTLLAPFHNTIRVIPVGSNIPDHPVSQISRHALRQRHFQEDVFLISTFGDRNHDVLTESIANLNETGANIGLLICGKTRTANRYKNLPWVYSTGQLPASEINAWLQSSDLFVMPDFLGPEGEGGACLKSGSLAAAFAAGLPVIGVQGDMTGQPLIHGQNIWLLSGNKVIDFREAIAFAVKNKSLCSQLRMGGRALYSTYLAWDIISNQYLESILSGKGVATHI